MTVRAAKQEVVISGFFVIGASTAVDPLTRLAAGFWLAERRFALIWLQFPPA